MKIVQLLLVFFLIPLSGFASCAEEPHSLSEMLLHDSYEREVFSAKVVHTFMALDGYPAAILAIQQVYKGEPVAKKVLFNFYQDGPAPQVGEKWLIVASPIAVSHYQTTVCDQFTMRLDKGDQTEKSTTVRKLLRQYAKLKRGKNRADFRMESAEGALLAKGAWRKGQPYGQWQHYYVHNGALKSEVNYGERGQLLGLQTRFFQDGDKRSDSWRGTQSRLDSVVTYVHGPAYLQTERVNYTYFTGGHNRRYELTDSNGLVFQTHHVRVYDSPAWNDFRMQILLHGDFQKRYPNGQVEEQGQYVMGGKSGRWESFQEDGRLRERIDYPELPPLASSIMRIYHQKGQLQLAGELNADDEPTGEWRYYYDNGQVLTQGQFLAGKKSGEWPRYHIQTGELLKTVRYVDGVEQ